MASSVPLNGSFLRAWQPPAEEPTADHLPILVNGYPGRIDVWTRQEWDAIEPAARPEGARLVKDRWMHPVLY